MSNENYEPFGPEWKKEMSRFKKPELIALLKNELQKACDSLAACKKALAAMHGIHKAFGAPGDYGYGTRKGDALNDLYASSGGLAKSIKEAENNNSVTNDSASG